MGAMTYIGNGPNFMVKSLAEEVGSGHAPVSSAMSFTVLRGLFPVLVLVTLLLL